MQVPFTPLVLLGEWLVGGGALVVSRVAACLLDSGSVTDRLLHTVKQPFPVLLETERHED